MAKSTQQKCEHKKWKAGFKVPSKNDGDLLFVITCNTCKEILHLVGQEEIMQVLVGHCMGRKFTLKNMKESLKAKPHDKTKE
jgi:hypothetical protein